MRRIRMFVLLAAAVSGAAACEGENLFRSGEADVTGPGDAGLVYEAVNLHFDAGAPTPVDLIEEGGSFQLILDESALLFESRFRFGSIDHSTSGSFGSDEGILTFSDDPFLDDNVITARAYEFQDAGDILVLRDVTAVLDSDNDGFEEVGSLDVWMERTD